MSESPPSQPPADEVTRLLRAAREGDGEALDLLLPKVYAELRRIAQRQLRRERPGHTLVATALVHEAYMRLAGQGGAGWSDRAHFFAIAARSMRQVLVDHARRKAAEKRGGDLHKTSLTGHGLGFEVRLDEMLALDKALDALAEVDDRLREVVEMRFFGGLEEAEVAEVLGVSTRTVQRDWRRARAWLYRELYPEGEGSPGDGREGG